MASELDLPKALAELITQLNNLRKLVTIGGKQYRYDPKSKSYKSEGKSFSVNQLKGQAREFYKTIKTTRTRAANRIKIRPKKESKSYTRKKGELTTTRKPQYKIDAENKAAKEKLKLKKKARWEKAKTKQQRAASGSFNVKEEWNPKTKKWETRYGEGTTKPRQRSPFKKAKDFVKQKGPKAAKTVKNVARKISKVKGVKPALKIGGKGLNALVKPLAVAELVDGMAGGVRQGGNIYRRIKGQPLLESIGGLGKAEKYLRIKEKNEYLKKHGSLKGFHKSVSPWNKKKTDNNKTTPTTSQKDGGNNKGKDAFSLPKSKVTFERQYSKPKTKDKKPQPNTEKKSTAQIEWEKKTRNSPARKSGAFKDKELWELQKRHRAWKAARKAGKLDEWRKKYKSR